MTPERYLKLQTDASKLRESESDDVFDRRLSGFKQEVESDLFSLIGKYRNGAGAPGAEARPLASQRATLRLLGRFDLQRIAEFITLNELRVDLESVLLDILQASTEDEQSAGQLQLVLRHIREEIKRSNRSASAYPIEEIDADIGALALVEKQAKALKYRANLDSAAEPLSQLLRPVYEEVSENWATLSKRLRRPLLLSVVGALVGISVYFLMGMSAPTVVLLGIPLFATVMSFLCSYLWQQKALESDLQQRKRLLLGLDPIPRRVAMEKRFWEVSDPDKILAAITNEVRKRSLSAEKTWVERGLWNATELILSILIFSLLPSLIIVGLLSMAKHLPVRFAPKYQVFVNDGGHQICSLGSGWVLWPGPVDIVFLRDSDQTPVVIRRSRLVSISQSVSKLAFPSCGQNTTAGSEDDTLKDQNQSQADQKSNINILALFKPLPIHNPPFKNTEIVLTDASQEQIEHLRTWVGKCGADVVVHGFATEKPFHNLRESQKWNYQLGEYRCQAVVKALGITNPSPKCFANFRQMENSREFRALSDKTEDETQQMGRSAVVTIAKSGSCTH